MRYYIYTVLLFILVSGITWSQDTTKTATVSAGQSFNPDISVIGDFLGNYTNKSDDGLMLREIELAFSGYVDPYTRADVFLDIDNEGDEYALELEEGYFTFLALPYHLQAKVGRFKTTFGKINTQHLHSLPWVEYPLMVRNYFGKEGWSAEGVSISWLTPANHYLEINYEAFNSGEIPLTGARTGNLSNLIHIKNYWDITDNANIELGVTGMLLPLEEGSNKTSATGLDFIYRWRPEQGGKYRSLMWQTELLTAQKETATAVIKSLGLFSALEYQFDQRWFAGSRFDYAELPDDTSQQTREYSAYLTFKQSEYAYWRLGYAFTNSDDAEMDNQKQVFLQLSIGIGAHRAHKY